MATISDVARLAGVSEATVSRVLNNNSLVNGKTKERVMQAIAQLQYVPSINARGMRNKSTGIIGVVFPEYMNPFGYELIQNIEQSASRAGYHTMITSLGTDDDKVQRVQDLNDRSVDGIVVYLYGMDQKLHDYLYHLSLEKPVIFLEDFLYEKPVNKVLTEPCMTQIVDYLLKKGHRRIGIIRASAPFAFDGRFVSFRNALRANGLEPDDKYIFNADYSMQSGYFAGKYFASLGAERPDAIVSYTDLMAIGAISYLLRNKISVPGDIAVTGYDDISIGRYSFPPLTTYHQDYERLGAETVNLFLENMTNPEHQPREIRIKGELVIRESA